MPGARRIHPVNLANAFTSLRIVLVPVFAWFLVLREPSAPVTAAVVFALAAATDGVDGWVARRLHLVSGFGQFLDPLADKLLVGVALVALAADGRMPWWAVVAIVTREAAVSVLRVAFARSGRSLPAVPIGKLKTGFQIASVLLLTLLPRGDATAQAFLYVTVALTVVSGAVYFARAARGEGTVDWR